MSKLSLTQNELDQTLFSEESRSGATCLLHKHGDALFRNAAGNRRGVVAADAIGWEREVCAVLTNDMTAAVPARQSRLAMALYPPAARASSYEALQGRCMIDAAGRSSLRTI